MSDHVQILLDQLRTEGARLRAVNGRVQIVQPPGGVSPDLAARARSCKAELLALLERESSRPRDIFIDGRYHDVVWLDQLVAARPPHADCYCCRSHRWWRLRGYGDDAWVCARCHPPQRREDEIEWAEGSEGHA